MSIPTKPIIQLRAQSPGAVNAILFSKTGEYSLHAEDKQIRLWKPSSGSLIKTFTGHSYEILALDLTKDDTQFLSCGFERGVWMWDTLSAKTLRKFNGHSQRVNAVAYNEDGQVFVSGSYDKTVCIWDTRKSASNKPLQVLEDAKDSITSVSISNYEIVASSMDGCIRRYDMRLGRCIAESVGTPITSATYSKDKNCMLISSLDSTIRLLDMDSSEILSEYRGHKNEKYKVQSVFNGDDSHILSGSEDGNVYVWDLVEETIVGILEGHKRGVLSLSYHPTETMLLSGSTDGTVILWGSVKES